MYTEAWAFRSKKREARSKNRDDVPMIRSYKDIKAYEKSYKMSIKIYQEVRKFPKEELFGMTSQLKRAAASIPLNIAEGYGKRVCPNEFKRFLLMAIGSCDEMKVLLEISKDLGFIDIKIYEEYVSEYEEIGKILNGLYKRWE